jgi:hypothetical protein
MSSPTATGPLNPPPAGWYGDPWNPNGWRWWDGRMWTPATRPVLTPPPSTPGPPSSDPARATADRSGVPFPGQVVAELDAPLQIARWRVVANPILALPHLLILAVLFAVCLAGLYLLFVVDLFIGLLLVILGVTFPYGLFAFLAGMQRYQWRVVTFMLFLREQYPAFSLPMMQDDPGGDPARISFPDIDRLWKPGANLWSLIRLVLLVPQILFGIPLALALLAAMIGASFAVLVTGRWPAGLRRFVLGILSWAFRVNAWAFHLTKRYPPFRIG